MKSSLPVRKDLLMSALAIAMTFPAASASAARAPDRSKVVHWDACKSIPRYPHGLPGMYITDPIMPADQVPENLVSQVVYDPLDTILAWYKKALPGWGFAKPAFGAYPQIYTFFQDGVIRREVDILSGVPSSLIEFDCYTYE